MPETRILVIANHLLARTGLSALLEIQPEFDVVGQIALTADLADDLNLYRPDVVMVDLGYEPPTAFPVLSQLVELPMVVLLPDDEYLTETLAILSVARTYGVLLRESSPDLLAQACRAAFSGLVVFDPALMQTGLPIRPELPPPEDLTPREFEVLQFIAQGLTNKGIALELDISTNTVKFHVNAILSKLNAQSRTEAVVRATQFGLILL